MNEKPDILQHMFNSLMVSRDLPRSELEDYCQRQLQTTLVHAAKTAPFYKDRLKKFQHENVPFDQDAWLQIPVLTRNDIKDQLDDICSDSPPKQHGKPSFGGTSGSSGLSILVKRTEMVSLMMAALQNRFFTNQHLNGANKMVQIKGDTIGPYPDGETTTGPWMPPYIFHGAPGDIVALRQPIDLEKQLEFLNRQGRCYLNTQPSNLAGLASLYKEKPGEFPRIDIAGIITIGELVQPHHRALARDVFHCQIFDQYTATEVGNIASQCEQGYLHVNAEANLVEILRDDGTPCADGEEGRIVITSTINWAMLLIRYDIGDRGALSHGCDCGSNLPVLKMTVGRERNLFKFSDGTSVSGLIVPANYHEKFPVRQWQIAQTGTDEITVRYTTDRPAHDLDENYMGAEMRLYFKQPGLTVQFDRRSTLPLTSTGKLLEAKREIDI